MGAVYDRSERLREPDAAVHVGAADTCDAKMVQRSRQRPYHAINGNQNEDERMAAIAEPNNLGNPGYTATVMHDL